MNCWGCRKRGTQRAESPESEEKGEDKMYVLSNRARSNGAACMIYPYVLRMMGDILEEDFFIYFQAASMR